VQLLVEALRRLTGNPAGSPGRVPSSGSKHATLPESKHEPPPRLVEEPKPQNLKQQSPPTALIDAVTVQRVSRELAHHIGPIANSVVRRAASLCASTDELYIKVAEEIKSPQERDRFLQTHFSIASPPSSGIRGAPPSRVRQPQPPGRIIFLTEQKRELSRESHQRHLRQRDRFAGRTWCSCSGA
jgi:hypothetical protein